MTTPPLCFVDTETTGVHPGRRPWEIAIIRRDPARTVTVIQISDVDLSDADPYGLKVGGFYDRSAIARVAHDMTADPGGGPRWDTLTPRLPDGTLLLTEEDAAPIIWALTTDAHIVGAVPNFDTETLAALLRRHGLAPAWHYHLIDVEALAVGYLQGEARRIGPIGGLSAVRLPWSSDDLGQALGVTPAAPEDRHTALGDALWAERMYDAVMDATS